MKKKMFACSALALVALALLGCGGGGGSDDGDKGKTYDPQKGANLAKELTANKVAITQSAVREVILRSHGFYDYEPSLVINNVKNKAFSPFVTLSSRALRLSTFGFVALASDKYDCDYSGYQIYSGSYPSNWTTEYYNCSFDGISFLNGVETETALTWAGYDYAIKIAEDVIESEPSYSYSARTSGFYELGLKGIADEEDEYAEITEMRNQNQTVTITKSGVTYTVAYANYSQYYHRDNKNSVENGDFGIKYANGDIFAIYTSANLIDGGCPRPDVGKFGVGEGNITGSTAAKIRITYTETTAKVDFLEDGVTPANIFSGDCAAYTNWLEGD